MCDLYYDFRNSFSVNVHKIVRDIRDSLYTRSAAIIISVK